MKNIRTVCLLSATCLTLMSADSSFASLYQSFYPGGYTTGRAAESTSICRGAASSHIGRSSHHHTHLAAALPAPHTSSDTAIQSYFNGSPRRINSPRDDTADLFISTTAQSEQRDLFAPINQQQTDGIDLPQVADRVKLRQLASVCFITDTGECAGDDFNNTDRPGMPDNPDDWDNNPGNRCREEGYVNTVCPDGSKPGSPCPYDSDWHSGCICDPEYNKACNGYDEAGKGNACNGLYKECCNQCSDYPYTTTSGLPAGYVLGASCNSCSGIRYKAACDTSYKYSCTGSHQSGGSGTACDGKYKSCKCQSGYGWNNVTGTCDVSCDPAYDLTCTRSSATHISGGDGSACDGKYQRCKCESGYTWVSSGNYCKKNCDTSYKYSCTGLYQDGGSGTACDGKYTACRCEYGYVWSAGSGACVKDCSGCAIGCIYNSDSSCSSVKESGKTPLGVVAYKNGSNMQVIALRSVGSEADYKWSTEDSLANIKLSLFDTEVAAESDIDSCGNTAAIMAAGSRSDFPGVYAAYNYRPSGTPGGRNWCLPAAGVLASIRDNIDVINDGIAEAGGTQMGRDDSGSLSWYWSSTLLKTYLRLRYVWTYMTNGSSYGTNNKLYESIANSNTTGSTDDSFMYRSVLDVSDCGSGYKYQCIANGSNHISGGSGTACGGKYTACRCDYGYTWNSSSGTCESNCDSSYKYNCNGLYEVGGIAPSCDGLFRECQCLSDYTWNSLTGACEKQCGPEYKYFCTYDYNKHISGAGVGTACDGKYTACQCMSGYSWNSGTGTCERQCGPEYKYVCGYNLVEYTVGGMGVACDGKYTSCQCMTDYAWNATSGTCEKQCGSEYKYTCTYSSVTHISGGEGIACDGKYKACKCMPGYTWNPYSWTCEKDEPQCDSSYKYLCNIGNQNGGKGQTCGGLYKECNCAPGSSWNGSDCVMNSSSGGGSSDNGSVSFCVSYSSSDIVIYS